MKRKRIILSLIIALAVVGPASAQSLAELLQKGIYTQETVGDLDAAIQIYKQITAHATDSRSYAAQAQYRLGLCYLQKGQKADATAAFEKLIKDYADQKELVEKARQYVTSGSELLPEPWVDGEVLEYTMRLESGAEAGTMIWTTVTTSAGGKDFWLIKNLRSVPMTPTLTEVFAERVSFRPVQSSHRTPALPDTSVEYGDGKVTVERAGKDDPDTMPVEGLVFDNEQVIHLIRRLPLAPGYKITLPVFTAVSQTLLKLDFAVTETKTIEVPAGKFDCFTIETKIGQTYWISTDLRRYPVRLDAANVIIELKAIHQKNSMRPVEYRDEDFGFTVKAPAGWFLRKQTLGVPENEAAVFLVDPDGTATTSVWAGKLQPGKKAFGGDLRAHAKDKITDRRKVFKDYAARPDSWVERTLNGRPALGYTADFVFVGKAMVEYIMFIAGESTALSALAKLDRDSAADFRKRFDAIVDSLTLR